MILVTGANGHLGRQLVAALTPETPVRAVVRSQRAARTLAGSGAEVRILDYLDPAAMLEAARGCSHIVHLVGIIREAPGSRFADAHEGTTAVVAEAGRAAGVQRIVYLSILGAAADSANPCLASKARAERLLLDARVPALVLRIPMVLGEGDHASRALSRRATARLDVQYRASSLEQPIYAGDVVAAVRRGLALPGGEEDPGDLLLELAGPESLSRRELTRRAAGVLGLPAPVVVSLPMWVGMLLAGVLERLLPSPPVSRAMLGVLDHDDRIDPGPARDLLGLALTPLDEMLRRCLVAHRSA